MQGWSVSTEEKQWDHSWVVVFSLVFVSCCYFTRSVPLPNLSFLTILSYMARKMKQTKSPPGELTPSNSIAELILSNNGVPIPNHSPLLLPQNHSHLLPEHEAFKPFN